MAKKNANWASNQLNELFKSWHDQDMAKEFQGFGLKSIGAIGTEEERFAEAAQKPDGNSAVTGPAPKK